MTAQMRAMLDELMGTARNGKKSGLFTNARSVTQFLGGSLNFLVDYFGKVDFMCL